MTTPKSKIAGLPRAVREELNRRLDDGESGSSILAWLNKHPDVLAFLKAHFEGHPLNPSNLGAWKDGPFREWQARRDLFENLHLAAGDASQLTADLGPVIDHAAGLLAARYTAALAAWDGDPASPATDRLRALSFLRRDLVALQRSQQITTRVNLEKARFDEELRKVEEQRLANEAYQKRLKSPEHIRQRKEFTDRMMGRSGSRTPTSSG